MDRIKALSLTNPYGPLIMSGEKGIETRSWGTPYMGRVAIQATSAYPRWAKQLCQHEPFKSDLGRFFNLVGWKQQPIPTGAILGIAEIYACYPITEKRLASISVKERAYGNYALPQHEGEGYRYAWYFRNIVLPMQRVSDLYWIWAPIPQKGAMGLWDWEVPDFSHQLSPHMKWVPLSELRN